MTILTALATLYEQMKEAGKAPRPGYSMENIGGEVVLDAAGKVLQVRRQGYPDGNKWRPKKLSVPVLDGKRTSGVKPNRFWDKTAYTLGVTALKDDKGKPRVDEDGHRIPGQEERTEEEHEAFREHRATLLAGSDDPGLVALRLFLETWCPDAFAAQGFPPEVLDENMVFRLDGDTDEGGAPRFIHDRPAAMNLLSSMASEAGKDGEALCLITGTKAPVARLHLSIKGVRGAQSSGAALVSFNNNAYESFGRKQGENAPVSQQAAFAYSSALNRLLARDSGHNMQIGDATVVFWAETPERAEAAQSIEQMLFGGLNPPDDDAECNKLRAKLEAAARGRRTQAPDTFDPDTFDPDTRVYVLGLAPNAARLSVRFWHPGTLGGFARHITRFWKKLELEPSPPQWKTAPKAWSLLCETALQGKARNIPPRLGGDLMRTVLTGAPLPRTLLSGVIARIRADGDINGKRAAICRAVINQNTNREEIPMSLDRDNPNPAYRLGRLFAVLESIQQKARDDLNATIRDRYFAAASATPARIFPQLAKTATHHLAVMRKGDRGRLAHWLDREMGTIWGGLEPDLPRSLNLEDQGRFVVGYYHQRWTKKDTAEKNIGGVDTPQDDALETRSTK